MNAIAERWTAAAAASSLDRALIWNLRRILHQYETPFNQHRPHRPLTPLPR